MDKRILPLAVLLVGLFAGMFTLVSHYQTNSQTLSTERNYQFDIAIRNIAQPRMPTQYDIPIGIVTDVNGAKYKLYESRTLVKNDFSKVFIGGKA